MFIQFLQTITRPMFGAFDRDEFKKFLRMGLIFALIIGSYWTLRVLKDSLFMNLVHKDDLPWAKTFSLICLFPLLMLYTKLLDMFSREKVLYLLSAVYGLFTLSAAALLLSGVQAPAEVIAARTGLAWLGTKVFGYVWYAFVESYGSLVVALFWAIAADITSPDSAKRGFPFVVAVGQLGGIVMPMVIGKLPGQFGFTTSALSLFVCSMFMLGVIWFVRYFMRVTPAHLLESFHGKNEAKVENEQEPGFLEGLRLLVRHGYLLGIFGIIFIFELIVTIFDFNFKNLAGSVYKGVELDAYLSKYASSVNLVALICLLLGVSNITRLLGVGVALAMMPVIFAGAIFGFINFNDLNFLFALMVGAKAINYALNGPAIKQLYIPTTHDVRFKAQAWIETFGSRGSKEAGSIFNMLLKPFKNWFGEVAGRARYISLSGYLGFALVIVWFFTALYLGKTHKKALEQKRVIC